MRTVFTLSIYFISKKIYQYIYLDPARTLLGQEGVVPYILENLKSSDISVLKSTSAALGSILKGSIKNKRIFMKNQGTSILIKILKTIEDEAILLSVLISFKNIATNESISNEIVELNSVPILINIIKSGSPKLKKEAVYIIESLSSNSKFQSLVNKEFINFLISTINASTDDVAIIQSLMNSIERLSASTQALEYMEPLIAILGDLYKKYEKTSTVNSVSKALKALSTNDIYRLKINSYPGLGKSLVSNDSEPTKSKYSEQIDKLAKAIDDPDLDKAAEAAKQLAEFLQYDDLDVKKELLEKNVFSQLWTLARAGRLGWADKWYTTIDPSKVKFKAEIGSGTFAVVYKGVYKHKGKKEEVAIKAMDEEKVSLSDLRCEMATLSMLTGVVKNIVELRGYFYLSQKLSGAIKTVKKYHCLVLELMETSLEDIIHHEKKKVSLTVEQMRKIAYEIALGMKSIHNYNILHRDLKPANILLTKQKHGNYLVKIGDFGYARRDSNESIRRSVVGTPAYLAPELFGQNMSFDVSKKADVYSYGVIVWEMVTRKFPHDGLEMSSMYKLMSNANEKNIPLFTPPSDCDPLLKTIIESCVIPKPDQRPHFTDIVKIFDEVFSNETSS